MMVSKSRIWQWAGWFPTEKKLVQIITSAPRSTVVHRSILCDLIQPNPSADWLNPTQLTTNEKILTQPDPTYYN